MERPTKEVKLPKSKMTAYVAEYYTRGEKKIVEAAQYTGSNIKFVNGDTVFDNISHNFIELKEDAMMLQGVKKISKEDGSTVDLNTDFLNTLADSDIQVLILECKKSYVGEKEPSGKKNS